MNISIGVGSGFIIEEVFKKALRQARDTHPKSQYELGLVFYTKEVPEKKIWTLLKNFPHTQDVLAIKTHKLITSEGLSYPGIAIILFSCWEGEDIGVLTFPNFKKMNFPPDSEKKVFEYKKKHPQIKPEFILSFIDTPLLRVSLFIRGFQNILGVNLPMFSLSSAEGFSFHNNEFYHNGEIIKEGAVSILFSGRFSLHLSQRSGLLPIGNYFTITKCYENIIEEIDNDVPLRIYEEILPGKEFFSKKDLFPYMGITYPLGIFLEEDLFYIRQVIKVLEDGSFFCQGDVGKGRRLKMLLATRENLHKGIVEAGIDIKKGLQDKKIILAFVLSSLARLKILGTRISQDIYSLKKVLGENLPLVGIFTHKESFLPFINSPTAENSFQNNSLSLICFTE